jgi:hypothetical protein
MDVVSVVIVFSLLMTPESTVELDALWEEALPAVIDKLGECGYTVHHEVAGEAIDEQPSLQRYRLDPGAATLTAVTDDAGGGRIEFTLKGDGFAASGGPHEADPVLWMGLVTLGIRYGETYTVLPSVADPDLIADNTCARCGARL